MRTPIQGVSAQTGSATPVPASESLDLSGTLLPAGISIVDAEGSTKGNPIPGGMLRMVRPGGSLANFNPAAFEQDLQVPWSYLEPLVRPDSLTLRPIPALADHWEWRRDGLELALSVRDDVTWHDGSPLSASDVAFSYEVYRDDTASAVSGTFALLDSIEEIDSREVLLHFAARDPNWLFNGGTLPVFSSRQYRDYWDQMPEVRRTLSGFDWINSLPIGTGPWKISDWDDNQITFERFQGYWATQPHMDVLELAVENGPQTRLEAWAESESQIAWPIQFHQVQQLSAAIGKLYPVPAASVMFAAFNFANPEQPAGSLWSDLQVRTAASMAINRERYAAEVFSGFVQWDAAGTVAQPWAHDPAITNSPHNPERAAVLLDGAGWLDYDGDGVREDANGWPLRPIAILREDSRPELVAVMARVARDLAGVGIGMTVEVLPANEFDERRIAHRNFDLIAYAYDLLPGFTDFDLYGSDWDIRTNPAGWNPGGYANGDADAAIEEFLSTISISRQAMALRKLQQAVNDDLFGLWLGFPDDLVLVASDVEGFSPNMAWQTARTWDLWHATIDS